MNPGKYISELLYRYDCVIIPGFGGFVLNRLPARIDKSKQIFYPPSKTIAFNRLLKNNDGLLVNHIAGRDKISYASALSQVDEFAGQCNTMLNQGIRLEIANVGVLFIDRERNIRFEPGAANFLQDAFGLDILHAAPVSGRQLLKRKTMVKSLPPEVILHRRKGMIAATVYTIFGMIIMTSLLYFSFKDPWYNNFLSNYTSLNFFKEAGLYFPRNDVHPFAGKGRHDPTGTGSVIPDSTELLLHGLLSDAASAKSKTEEEPSSTGKEQIYSSDEQNTAGSKETGVEKYKGKKYFIIGGCFKIKENAERFIRKMKRKGFDSEIVDRTRGGLYRVCYGNYQTKTDALQALNEVRSSENSEAWLLVHS